MYKAFLFDYDGTIARTMHMHFMAWRKALLNYNINIKKNDYYPLEGMNLHEISFKLSNQKISKLMSKTIVLKKKSIFNKSVKKDNYYSNVKTLINKLLKNNYKIGLVTSSHKDQLLKSSSKQFLNLFDAVVFGDEVKRNKPYPDPFIKCSLKLKLNKKNCVAIENSPIGIESAKRAGMLCLAVCNTNKKKVLNNADFVYQDIRELLNSKFINKLIK